MENGRLLCLLELLGRQGRTLGFSTQGLLSCWGLRGLLSLAPCCSDGETEARTQASSLLSQGSVLPPVRKAESPQQPRGSAWPGQGLGTLGFPSLAPPTAHFSS